MSKRRKVGQIEKAKTGPKVYNLKPGAVTLSFDPEIYPSNLFPFQKVALDNLERSVRGAHIYGRTSVAVTHRPELLSQEPGTITGRMAHVHDFPSPLHIGRNWVRERYLQARDEVVKQWGPAWDLLDVDYSKLEERVMIWDESHVVLDSLTSYADTLAAFGDPGPKGLYREKPPLLWKHDFKNYDPGMLRRYAKSDAQLAERLSGVKPDTWHAYLWHQLAIDPVPMIRIHGDEIKPASRMMQEWLRNARALGLPVVHECAKDYLRRNAPSVHTLMNAAWQAGYTCNGINP